MTQESNVTIVKETKLYSEAVALTGYGKYNLYVLLTAGGCLMCVIIETMCMSFIIPAAQCDLNLSLAEKGVLVSISFLGVIFSSHFWGFMADARGRKNVLVFCLITSSLLSLVCSLVPWAWLFILLRFSGGALIGGASSVIYPFAGEFHDDSYRPMVISWISAFVAAGQTYISGMAWAILPHDWIFYVDALGIAFRPWRLLLMLYALPSLIVAAMMSILPESPKFLLVQGKHDHTLKILTRMFVVNQGKKTHEYPVSTIILDEVHMEKTEEKQHVLKILWRQTALLFSKAYLLKTVLICYLQFGIFLSASALALWFPDILNTLSKNVPIVGNEKVTLCGWNQEKLSNTSSLRITSLIYPVDMWKEVSNITTREEECDDLVDTSAYLVVLLIGVATGVAYIIIGIIINRIGKKTLLIGVATVTAICGLTAQYISGYETILVLCGIYMLISSMIGVVNAFAVDLYPTHVRAMALAISLMFGRFGALVGSNIVGVLFYSYCDYIFIFFAINHLVLITSAILLPTKKTQTATSKDIPIQIE